MDAAPLALDNQTLRLAALGFIERFNAAMLELDAGAAQAAFDEWDDLAKALNGNTSFGYYGRPEASWPTMERLSAAPDGVPPLWGQKGQFAIAVNGIAAWVEYRGMYSWNNQYVAAMGFRAIDMKNHFISAAGSYWYFLPYSLFSEDLPRPFSLLDCARWVFASLQMRIGVRAVNPRPCELVARLSRLPAVRAAYAEALEQAPTAPTLPPWRAEY